MQALLAALCYPVRVRVPGVSYHPEVHLARWTYLSVQAVRLACCRQSLLAVDSGVYPEGSSSPLLDPKAHSLVVAEMVSHGDRLHVLAEASNMDMNTYYVVQ